MLLIGYVGLIYSTLQFMPKINSLFSSLLGRYFDITANILVSAIIIAIFVILLKRNSRRKSPIFYISVIAVFGLYTAILFSATPIVAEKMHLLEYGFLSYLALRAVQGAQGKIGTVPEAAKGSLWGLSHFSSKQSLYVILIIIIVGSLDELIQKFTPGRYCELRDVALNIASGILGLFVLKLLKVSLCLTNSSNLLQ